MKSEYLYGANTCEEIIKSGKRRVFKVVISRKKHTGKAAKIISIAKRRKIPVTFEDPKYMDKLARRGNHQGILIEVEPVESVKLYAAAEEAGGKKEIWAAVDSITDPMNLGSIIRSCACFGVASIIIPERRTVGLTPAAQKAASGALEKIKIIKVVNLNQAIIDLKEKGFWIYGADMSGKSLNKIDFAFPALMIIGSEGDGMHMKTKEHCDELVSISQKGGVESLNASVAAGILFYEMSERAKRKSA